MDYENFGRKALGMAAIAAAGYAQVGRALPSIQKDKHKQTLFDQATDVADAYSQQLTNPSGVSNPGLARPAVRRQFDDAGLYENREECGQHCNLLTIPKPLRTAPNGIRVESKNVDGYWVVTGNSSV